MAPTSAEKGVPVEKQSLDSIVCPNHYKYLFSYDERGNNILILDYQWNKKTNSWVEINKVEYLYDDAGNMTTEIIYGWANASQTWEVERQSEYDYDSVGNKIADAFVYWVKVFGEYRGEANNYIYDANNRLTTKTEYRKEGTDWIEQERTEYTYGADGRLTTELVVSKGDKESGKTEYTYDDNALLTKEISYAWDGDKWEGDKKDEYAYDDKGNKIKHITYFFWDDVWSESYDRQYTYDDDGNMTGTSGGDSDGRYAVTYDNKGHITESMEYYYDGSQKTIYTYNDNGDPTERVQSYFDEEENEDLSEKIEYTFNPSYSKADLITYNSYNYTNMLTTQTYYDHPKTDWTPNAAYTCYWSAKTIYISETKNPEPAKETYYKVGLIRK
jgi:hypothetical protein